MRWNNHLIAWLVIGLAIGTDLTSAKKKNWLLLVAGNKGWNNYGIQSDICHTYQVAHAQGIPDEQIVVMMYDDIAHHDYNPWPGKIINHPDGPNVYEGVCKDYTGDEVNGDVFFAALQGDKEGVKKLLGRDAKVIDSGPEDHIFVHYSGHGGKGLVSMAGKPSSIYATDLNEVLKNMHAQKKFAKLSFYVDSCYAGSMFHELLPVNIDIYSTTASRPDECAYFCYFVDELGTYVGGEYSVSWLENADEVDISIETLQEQYEIMYKTVVKSEVMQYGNLAMTSLTVDQFLGNSGKQARVNSTRTNEVRPSYRPITSDDGPIDTIKQLLAGPMGRVHRRELLQSLEEHHWLRENTQKIMEDVARVGLAGQDSSWAVRDQSHIKDWNCYRHAVDSLIELCPRLSPSDNDYIMQRLNILVNLCNSRPELAVVAAIKKVTIESKFCVM